MSFESSSLERIDLEKMHKKAGEVIEASRIREESFIEPYGEHTVQSDLQHVEKLERIFEERSNPESEELKMLADIFEAIVLEHGELSNWFGEQAVTRKTSRYDDYENGVDMVIEFQDTETKSASFLGLAADVTFTSDTTKKFDRLREQIEQGELAKVKYFHSDFINIHGQLSKLPEVIIGASAETVKELAEQWIEGERRALGRHRIQIMILKQMREELGTFALYADSIGESEAAAIYRERLGLIEGILEEKKDLEKAVGMSVSDDSVHTSIMNFLKRWKSELVQK